MYKVFQREAGGRNNEEEDIIYSAQRGKEQNKEIRRKHKLKFIMKRKSKETMPFYQENSQKVFNIQTRGTQHLILADIQHAKSF